MSFDHEWQINSIKKILKKSLTLLHISFVSPKIAENPRLLQCLKELEYLHFLGLCQEYIREKDINPSRPCNHLLKMIQFFDRNIQLLDHFKDCLDNFETLEESLVDAFLLLQLLTETRLQKSAISELKKEREVLELSEENEQIKRHIKVFQDVLKRKRLYSKWKQAAEEVLIQYYEKRLANFAYKRNLRIKQEMVLSSSSIRRAHASSVARQNELKEELHRIERTYDNLLKENLRQEKSARHERNRMLFQFESLVKKYDLTIGDKTKEGMDLEDEYNKQRQVFDSVSIAYYQQEAKYEQIVQAKEEEEKYHHEQKILLFMMNRSARVIQKHWRKFRRVQKKTAKRNKGRGKFKNK